MSVGTVPPGSDGASTSSTKCVDSSNYVYNIPQSDLIGICYYLDKDNAWERVAQLMGFSEHDNIVSLYCKVNLHLNKCVDRIQMESGSLLV